ncbi:MAG: indole-3-glycerol phosphate synthase TrpC [Chloroflexi bacterium]|nr:indole-3-glycerol phosphate synthase TrpC [Chloroflexota bacterium]
MPADILNRIVAAKKKELKQSKAEAPISTIMRDAYRSQPLDFARALKGREMRLIAEVKQASPSKGVLRPDFDPVALAQSYADGGASAISVLTEVNYFRGSLEHLAAIREAVNLPLLRKDFIFDSYQIYESAAWGADAVLLIAAILSPGQLGEMLGLARSLGLACLVEAHNEAEVENAVLSGARIIGINNRDLLTFTVELDTTRRLRHLVPKDRILVSESGIKDREDVKKLKKWGVNAVLVGESLVTADDIPFRIRELLS